MAPHSREYQLLTCILLFIMYSEPFINGPVLLMISLLSVKLTILHFFLWMIPYRSELCYWWLGNELEVLQKVLPSTHVVQCK